MSRCAGQEERSAELRKTGMIGAVALQKSSGEECSFGTGWLQEC